MSKIEKIHKSALEKCYGKSGFTFVSSVSKNMIETLVLDGIYPYEYFYTQKIESEKRFVSWSEDFE